MAIKSHNRYTALPFFNGEQYTNRRMQLSAHSSKTAAVRELTHELMETQVIPVKCFEFRVYDRATGITDIYAPVGEDGHRAHHKTYNFASMTSNP